MKRYSHHSKSLSTNESKFILGLYEQGRPIFTINDALNHTSLRGQSFQNFLTRLVNKGILTNLCSGLYTIVPFELGDTNRFMANPYLVAREIIRLRLKSDQAKYYISHASAMDIHQMTTQPQFIVYACTIKQIQQKPIVLATEYHIVTVKKEHLFGTEKLWISPAEMIFVSDIEKTIIDGLKTPAYCGGITEVAKALWIKRDKIDFTKLVDYAEKMDIGAIYRRLGFILETYQIDCPNEIERLQEKLTKKHLLLDPGLLDEGTYQSRWRLRINIPKQEFLAVIRT
jgi:predicted transcriptional regulator of viral defense system